MTKRGLIVLADYIKKSNESQNLDDTMVYGPRFEPWHINILSDFCASQNCSFKRERWAGYINNTCGPNGGKIKNEPKRNTR